MTPKQSKLLSIIAAAIDRTGVSPSYDEMMVAMGQKSRSTAWLLVQSLIEHGYLVREGGHRRNLAVTPAGYVAVGGSILNGVSDVELRAELARRDHARITAAFKQAVRP